MSNMPVLKLESYPVTLAIWEKTGDSGYPYYSAKLEKRFKDNETGKWKSTSYLNDRDWLSASQLLQDAWARLKVQEVEMVKKEVENPF